MKLKRWGVALRRVEDFALENGGEEALFDRLCEFVTGGGYITDLCGLHAVDREVLLAWIRKDPERDRRWKQAEADRKDGHREEVLALWGGVIASPPEDGPDWAAVLSAARDMAKYTGVLPIGQGRAGTTVNVNLGDWGERLRQARSRTGQQGEDSIEIDVTAEGVALEQQIEQQGADQDEQSRDGGTEPRRAHNPEKPCDSAPATLSATAQANAEAKADPPGPSAPAPVALRWPL